MAYAYLNRGQARSILAQRLQDTGLVYYSGGNGVGSAVELNSYIDLAVRMWQGYTASYRQRASLTTAAGTPFYDLKAALTPAVLNHTTTDKTVVNWILSLLIEPPLVSTSWSGSGMFQFSAIMAAVQYRLNRFSSDSGVGVTRMTQAAAAPPQDRNFLPDSVLDVRRAAWLSSVTGKTTPMFRDDQFGMQAFQFNAGATDPPSAWGVFTLPPVGIQVFPPPAVNGTLDLLVVKSDVVVGTTPSAVFSAPVTLSVADDLVFGIVFGAMADLLMNDGPARDVSRAKYCEQIYTEAVEVARLNPTVLLTQINGQPTWTGSVFELDAFLPSWQSSPGPPLYAALAGRTLFALGPQADGVYGVTLDVAGNIPLPASDADFLQVDRGSVDSVLNLAQHIAMFKLGGAEFAAADGLRQTFLTAVKLENSRLRNSAVFSAPLTAPSKIQSAEVVRV